MITIGKRSEHILATIVSEYISTGEPVGSRTLSKRMGIGLSAASILEISTEEPARWKEMLSKMPADVARQVRDAVVTSAREYAAAGGVVRLSNETICFCARA